MKVKEALDDIGMAEAMASLGDIDALVCLGTIYFYGIGIVDKNKEKGICFFKKAAEKNSAEACFKLGLFYKDGRGVPQCKNTALYFFKQSAKCEKWFGNPFYQIKQLDRLGGNHA